MNKSPSKRCLLFLYFYWRIFCITSSKRRLLLFSLSTNDFGYFIISLRNQQSFYISSDEQKVFIFYRTKNSSKRRLSTFWGEASPTWDPLNHWTDSILNFFWKHFIDWLIKFSKRNVMPKYVAIKFVKGLKVTQFVT